MRLQKTSGMSAKVHIACGNTAPKYPPSHLSPELIECLQLDTSSQPCWDSRVGFWGDITGHKNDGDPADHFLSYSKARLSDWSPGKNFGIILKISSVIRFCLWFGIIAVIFSFFKLFFFFEWPRKLDSTWWSKCAAIEMWNDLITSSHPAASVKCYYSRKKTDVNINLHVPSPSPQNFEYK